MRKIPDGVPDGGHALRLEAIADQPEGEGEDLRAGRGGGRGREGASGPEGGFRGVGRTGRGSPGNQPPPLDEQSPSLSRALRFSIRHSPHSPSPPLSNCGLEESW